MIRHVTGFFAIFFAFLLNGWLTYQLEERACRRRYGEQGWKLTRREQIIVDEISQKIKAETGQEGNLKDPVIHEEAKNHCQSKNHKKSLNF